MLLHSPWIIFPLTIAILVFIHELGHYLVGKLFKFGVITFSIGFGPTLAAFSFKNTKYKICAIPLGGYVQFAGMTRNEDVKEHFKGSEFYLKPLWQRACVILAGPLANLLLAAIVLSYISFAGTPKSPSLIGLTDPSYPAHQAGIRSGDEIIAINDKPIKYWSDITGELAIIQKQYYKNKPDNKNENIQNDDELNLNNKAEKSDIKAIDITIKRDKKQLNLNVIPVIEDQSLKIGIVSWFLAAQIKINPDATNYNQRIDGSTIAAFNLEPKKNNVFSKNLNISNDKADHTTKNINNFIKVDKTFYDFENKFRSLLLDYLKLNHSSLYSIINSDNLYVLDKHQISQLPNFWQLFLKLTPADWQKNHKKTNSDEINKEGDSYEISLSVALHETIMNKPFFDWPQAILNSTGIELAQLIVNKSYISRKDNDKNTKTSSNKENEHLLAGDHILKVSGKKLNTIFDWYKTINFHKNSQQIPITVLRKNQILTFDIPGTARIVETINGPEKLYTYQFDIGAEAIFSDAIIHREPSLLKSIIAGSKKSFEFSGVIIKSVFDMIIGKISVKSLGGPIMIGKVASDSAAQGLVAYLFMLALISINLFILNLIPIPVLDGGQLALLGLEWINKKPMSIKFIENYQKIGFVFILCLMVLAFYNDISRVWINIIQS